MIALIAVVTAVAVGGSGMLGNSRLRSAATMVLSAIRTATTRANTIGRPVRIVFDFEERRVVLEEARGRMLRDREDETGAVGAEPATEAEREAKEYANEVLEGPRAPKPQFSAIGEFGDESGDGPGRELGSGIELRLVQTEHDDDAIVDGRAYLYFWPGGGTERAVIQLVRSGDSEGLTILVSALTGRAKIKRGAIELEEPRNENDFGLREEE